ARPRHHSGRGSHLRARPGGGGQAARPECPGMGGGRATRPVRGRGLPGCGRDAALHQPLRRGPPAQRVIRLDGVAKTYRTRRGGPVDALAEPSLTVEENEFVTLVGPSGCGKSTLLKLVAGLVPPTRGTIRVRDQIVSEPFPDVGFVFQQPVLLPWRSVLDN